jgi:uncharacterized peroxidase-related enzyme
MTMSRFTAPEVESLPAASRDILKTTEKRLGFIPNMHRLLALSPVLLRAVTDYQAEMSKALDARTRHGIALAVTEVNGCEYCRAAHSYYATNLGKLSYDEVARNLSGSSEDPKRSAAIAFAKTIAELRGKVSEGDLADVRAAGYTDSQILEIVGLSVQFLLTNFINNVAHTDSEFPDEAD